MYALTGVRVPAEPAGVGFAAANAVLFAAYIVLGHRVARRSGAAASRADGGPAPGGAAAGIDGLALAMAVAAALALPVGIRDAVPAFADPTALAGALGVAVSSSVVPYVCDQVAMARLSRGTYTLLVSSLPATATVIGAVVLRQVPAPLDIAGVALVVAGVALHKEVRPCDTPGSAAAG